MGPFNPAVSMVMAARGELPKGLLLPFVVFRLVGAMFAA